MVAGSPATTVCVPNVEGFLVLQFIARRLLITIPLLFLASIITFLLVANLGIPQQLENAMSKPNASPAAIQSLRSQFELDTPLFTLRAKGRFEVPNVPSLLRELRTMVEHARPTNALFRTNHASNYLPLAGELPRDRERIVSIIDAAIDGRVPMRAERHRGL